VFADDRIDNINAANAVTGKTTTFTGPDGLGRQDWSPQVC